MNHRLVSRGVAGSPRIGSQVRAGHRLAPLALTVAAGLWATAPLYAQNQGPAPAPTAAAVSVPLTVGTQEVLKLVRSKLGDDTIIAFIKNSSLAYNLGAEQVIFLRNEGVSEAVLNTMLTRGNGPSGAAIAASPAPSVAPATSSTTTYVAAPTSTSYVAAPATTVYVETPAYRYYYPYGPYYGYGYPYSYVYPYPAVSFSFGYRGGYGYGYHGGGYRGGFHGGFHGGGGRGGHR